MLLENVIFLMVKSPYIAQHYWSTMHIKLTCNTIESIFEAAVHLGEGQVFDISSDHTSRNLLNHSRKLRSMHQTLIWDAFVTPRRTKDAGGPSSQEEPVDKQHSCAEKQRARNRAVWWQMNICVLRTHPMRPPTNYCRNTAPAVR